MKRIWSLGVLILLAACNDPKAANEKNFAVAVQEFLESRPPACIYTGGFPQSREYEADFFTVRAPDLRFERAMVSAGIYRETVTQKPGSSTENSHPVYVFDLTDKGKEYFDPEAQSPTRTLSEKGGFCFGKPHLVEIKQFTEPSPMFGMTVLQVKYTYRVDGVPTWLNEEIVSLWHISIPVAVPEEQKPVEDYFRASQEPQAGEVTLILTNKGWTANGD